MSRPRLLVDIVTDIVCPWCYVGLRSFLAARERLARDFDLGARFRPYQLNPGTPEDGLDRAAYYAAKFPDARWLAEARARIAQAARDAGFSFDPSRPARLPNTLKAHAALRWAHVDGVQEPVALALYQAYWDKDADLGDDAVVARIAASAGLDEGATHEKLIRGEDLDFTAGEAQAMRAAGVTGVPTFIVGGRRGFSGALPPVELEAALRSAAQLEMSV